MEEVLKSTDSLLLEGEVEIVKIGAGMGKKVMRTSEDMVEVSKDVEEMGKK